MATAFLSPRQRADWHCRIQVAPLAARSLRSVTPLRALLSRGIAPAAAAVESLGLAIMVSLARALPGMAPWDRAQRAAVTGFAVWVIMACGDKTPQKMEVGLAVMVWGIFGFQAQAP